MSSFQFSAKSLGSKDASSQTDTELQPVPFGHIFKNKQAIIAIVQALLPLYGIKIHSAKVAGLIMAILSENVDFGTILETLKNFGTYGGELAKNLSAASMDGFKSLVSKTANAFYKERVQLNEEVGHEDARNGSLFSPVLIKSKL